MENGELGIESQVFPGNIDDCFRIGISLMKKCVKLYDKLYSSKIIVASPLGLRMIIIGSAGYFYKTIKHYLCKFIHSN